MRKAWKIQLVQKIQYALFFSMPFLGRSTSFPRSKPVFPLICTFPIGLIFHEEFFFFFSYKQYVSIEQKVEMASHW